MDSLVPIIMSNSTEWFITSRTFVKFSFLGDFLVFLQMSLVLRCLDNNCLVLNLALHMSHVESELFVMLTSVSNISLAQAIALSLVMSDFCESMTYGRWEFPLCDSSLPDLFHFIFILWFHFDVNHTHCDTGASNGIIYYLICWFSADRLNLSIIKKNSGSSFYCGRKIEINLLN